jgi:hypothetical protein
VIPLDRIGKNPGGYGVHAAIAADSIRATSYAAVRITSPIGRREARPSIQRCACSTIELPPRERDRPDTYVPLRDLERAISSMGLTRARLDRVSWLHGSSTSTERARAKRDCTR